MKIVFETALKIEKRLLEQPCILLEAGTLADKHTANFEILECSEKSLILHVASRKIDSGSAGQVFQIFV